jgi:hypothetical protein
MKEHDQLLSTPLASELAQIYGPLKLIEELFKQI